MKYLFYAKVIICSVLLTSFFACRDFNNPIDPASSLYLGYETTYGENATRPLYPISLEKAPYPTFNWEACPEGSIYAFQLALSSNFNSHYIKYETLNHATAEIGKFSYKLGEAWEEDTLSEYLQKLPVGYYWWRVSVNNPGTGNQWGIWSAPAMYEQKLHLTELYWDYNETEIKQGYKYYYSGDLKWEKELSQLKFPNETEARTLEIILTESDENHRPIAEYVYEPNNFPTNYIAKRVIEYEFDSKKRISIKRTLSTVNNGVEVNPPINTREDRYSYESNTSKMVQKIESYQLKNEEFVRAFLSEYSEGLQVRTTFFTNTDGNEEINYFYDVEYDEDYETRMVRAVYYTKSADSEVFEFYKNYNIDYNFPEIPTIVIGSGESITFSNQNSLNFNAFELRNIENFDIK